MAVAESVDLRVVILQAKCEENGLVGQFPHPKPSYVLLLATVLFCFSSTC